MREVPVRDYLPVPLGEVPVRDYPLREVPVRDYLAPLWARRE
ncbi:MAG TPA: hypothetical protein P5290_01455 [Candidatus Methanomethylicus sp.]|nr:hypothetical protein [Candidatus Methanomethylicus sp.]